MGEKEQIISMIQSKTETLLQNLLSFDSERRSFIEFELTLCKELNTLGAHILEQVIPLLYGDGYNGSNVEVDEETLYKCVARKRERGLITAFGKIKLTRAVYTEYHSGGIKSFLDEKLCVENKKQCPLITYWSQLLGTVTPFQEASDVLNKMRGINISRKQIEDSTEAMGNKIKDIHLEHISDVFLDDDGVVPEVKINVKDNAKRTVYMETDGCQIHTEYGWKECKTFTLFETEEKGEEQRIKNKFYYSTMKSVNELKRQLHYHLEKYCGKDTVQIVCIGDGAKWIWKSIKELFPKKKYPEGITLILDWYHAIEKIAELLAEILPEKTPIEQHLKKFRDWLSNGNVELVEQELTMLMDKEKGEEKRNKIYQVLTYIKNNKDNMRYDTYRKKGFCIGSGAIESANKYVIQRRIKLPGMRWIEDNANAMAHLRAEYINGLLDGHYHIVDNPLMNNVAVT